MANLKFNSILNYTSRAERNKALAIYISNELNIYSILNIGGGGARHLEQALKELHSSTKVFEIDMVGDCDLKMNLDEINRLEFSDQVFDVVCAMDVLEHLENFHLICGEMIRIARKKVIISLPISSTEIFNNILLGKFSKSNSGEVGFYSKFYGLPINKPDDRHRWWITYDDIHRYFSNISEKNKINMKIMAPNRKIVLKVLKFFVGSRIINNFFTPHLWIVLEK